MILSKNISCKTYVVSIACLVLLTGCATTEKAGSGSPEVPESVRLVIADTPGNKSDKVAPSGDGDSLIASGPVAVLPVENISKVRAPVHKLRQLSIDMLKEKGFDVLEDGVLDVFMEQHRIRYVGGIDREKSRVFKTDTKAGAVLVISLEHYDEKFPSKIAMTYRLVSTGDYPRIIWTDSAGLAGDDSPGILGLGLVKDPELLMKKTVQRLSASLSAYMSDPEGWTYARQKENRIIRRRPASMLEADFVNEPEELTDESYKNDKDRFRPKVYRRSSLVIDKERRYTVAVFPFFNRSERKYAGEILEMHFLRELRKMKNLDVIEPGVVREALLKSRVVMYDGISLDQAVVVSSMLNADMVLTGTVLDYEDYVGPIGVPRVDFSAMLIERKSREAIWTSKSYNEGDDSVFFFDFGKINTAHAMATEMTRNVAEMMFAD